MTQAVRVDKNNGITTLTLSRVDKKNALTNDMYKVLADTIEQAQADNTTRLLVFLADGDTFTAGNDISEFAAHTEESLKVERHVSRFLKQLASTTVPLLAAVQGKAVGIGTTMLLHCDYVLLADDAQLITPFVNLALVPEAASSYLMPARIGHARAFELFCLGDPLPAAKAVDWGIANQVVATADLHAEAQRIAARFAAKPLGAVRATKKLMRDNEKLLDAIGAESRIFFERLVGPEAKEAFAAFAEKRAPDFASIKE